MRTFRTFLLAGLISLSAPAFAAAPKAKQPVPKKFTHPVTVKDLALREAKTCDVNHNGKIDAPEMSALRMAQSKNPKSYLYLFDANENKYLDDSELGKIKFGPAKPPLTHQPGAPKEKK